MPPGKYGLGESVRYSDTLTEKTVYCAVRLDSGDILRVSDVQASTFTVLLSFAQPIFVVIIAVLILSAFAASRVSAGIVRPLNQMDLDSPSPVLEGYDELSPLFRRIEHQRATIEHQLEDAVKMREEFRMITENMSEGFLVIDRQPTCSPIIRLLCACWASRKARWAAVSWSSTVPRSSGAPLTRHWQVVMPSAT